MKLIANRVPNAKVKMEKIKNVIKLETLPITENFSNDFCITCWYQAVRYDSLAEPMVADIFLL